MISQEVFRAEQLTQAAGEAVDLAFVAFWGLDCRSPGATVVCPGRDEGAAAVVVAPVDL